MRERIQDVPLFVDHFLAELDAPPGKILAGIEGDCIAALQAYAWPGNIRELRNVVERALIVTHGPLISVADLPPNFGSPRTSKLSVEIKIGLSQREFTMELAQRRIAFAKNNKAEAARLLGIALTTVYNRHKARKASPAGRIKIPDVESA